MPNFQRDENGKVFRANDDLKIAFEESKSICICCQTLEEAEECFRKMDEVYGPGGKREGKLLDTLMEIPFED